VRRYLFALPAHSKFFFPKCVAAFYRGWRYASRRAETSPLHSSMVGCPVGGDHRHGL